MRILKILFFLSLSVSLFAQLQPTKNFYDLAMQAENDYQIAAEAKMAAKDLGLPLSIYTKEGVLIEVMGLENGQPVYGVITNLQNPFQDATTSFYRQISASYNLESARVYYGDGKLTNPNLGLTFSANKADSYLMVPESSNDRVMLFDANDGSLVNAVWIEDPTNLGTPIQAMLAPWGNVTVSDQLDDAVVEYDTSGSFVKILADINAGLDNVRGHNYRPDNGNIVVTVASGVNSDAIMEFDQSGGFIGNFIAPNAAVMDSPWDIIFRDSDVLVTASSSNAVHRYDLTGNYLDNLVPSIAFPEQIFEFSSGDLGVAGFSIPSGLYIYDANGNQKNFWTAITGNRGVYELGNGNIMTTNGGGVHILDGTNGSLISSPVEGVSARFVGKLEFGVIPVELTSFVANVVNGTVNLVWETATETNNSGFEVQRSSDGTGYTVVSFVDGKGTTTEKTKYNFSDQPGSGQFYYRLKQIDFDGTSTFSNSIMVDLGLPTEFSLDQNYPNPFNPSTNIQFSLPEASSVKLVVYNLLGQEVATLFNGVMEAGTHKVNFDAANLNTGLYVYKLEANDFVATKKMMLMK